MEHHEGVYEQIIEVNNANQGTEYISHHLVQEIVVQSDNNQGSPMHDIDIMLPNDCANAQVQCNSNVIISSSTDGFGHDKHTENVNLQQEPIKSDSINHLNHVEQNITSYDESYKEEYILHSQTPYHQGNFEENSTVVHVTNSNTGNNEIISETVTVTSESVSQIDENESVSIDDQPIHNHNLVNTSESIRNDLNPAPNKNVDESEQSNVYLNTEIEQSYVDSIPTDVVSNEVVQEVVMEEPQIQSENYCVNEHHEEVVETYATDSDVPCKNEETDTLISTEITEKMDYSMLVAEATSEDKIITNSDDVAVLTEFTSLEYSSTIDGPQEEVVISSEPIEVQDTMKENHQPQISEESTNQDASVKSEPDVISVEPTENNIIIEHIDQAAEANDTSVYDIDGEEDDLELHLSSQSENQRKVIQDIFDDWPDENGEDENNQSFKEHHDSVEMELQNLLNDDAQQEQIISSTSVHDINNFGSNKSAGQNTTAKLQSPKAEKASLHNKTPSGRSSRSSTNLAKDHVPGRSCKTSTPDLTDIKKIQSPRPGVKVPGAHLTSQIASTAEVNEVLKERLKEKQKDLVTPNTADIVFVKKITQRLSSQLSAAASALPTLIPLPSSLPDDKNKDKPAENSISGEVHKASSDKELLAILEGDVDPDWSDLKSQSLAEVSSSGDSNTGSKLDPSLERELALKQLQELPNLPSKKKQHKEQSDDQKNIIKKNLRSSEQSNSKSDSTNESIKESSPKKEKKKAHKENNTQNTLNETVELTVEESRSGRKRKLTEKAREHELSVKRHKEKGKTTTESKKTQNESEEKSVEKLKEESEANVKVEEDTKPVEKLDDLEAADGEEIVTTDAKGKLSTDKRKIGLVKKDTPIAKRKLAVKNFLRQKMTGRKSAGATKAKSETSTPIKATTPAKAASEKSEKSNEKSSEKSEKSEKSPAPVTKAKKTTEIDKLLQDEGIVNMLFDAEQPDTRKRLVPITKSQKKIMDVDKAERELKLRTKLVKNAVMRLRNSSASAVKILPRSRRSATGASPEQPMKESEKKSHETTTKQKLSSPPSSLPTEFIIPAKMHNAADASRIIRRHSSSSFSSASASPRVSVDMPPESLRSESPERPTKSKRKMSLDTNERVEGKKTKKRTLSKAESEEETNQKSPAKEPLKKLTRSNVAAASTTTKIVAKNKKVAKCRMSMDSSSSDTKSKSQDELMACLAEAASALLSNSSGSSRSSNTTTNRKKGSTNVSKTSDEEKVDIKKLSSYKEINVRQHGHLAQVILTPSSTSSGVRNALTIQVMNEIQDALTILKKHVECRVVLFTSTGTSFCEGLDLSSLLNPNKEERKSRVEEMAHTVKAFIKTIAAFNKPIVAGVQGAAIGLGVTMLPLFDLVIASDKATFSTPYGKLGQIAEGAAVFTLSPSLGSSVTNELLLGGRTLTASEALRAGLVTRVLWPDRFQSELLPSLKSMSEQSSQSMEATKALLRCTLRKKLDAAIESESLLLIQHWCSTECQEAIKAYIEEKVQ